MIALRPASPADCERVWVWNFSPDARVHSGNPQIVELAAHAAWYARRIAEPDAPMWIVEDDAAPVGVVRIDRDGRCSIALAADAHGRGIGRAALSAACAAWARPVVARVHRDNARSRACFESCGFSRDRDDDPFVLYRWSPS